MKRARAISFTGVLTAATFVTASWMTVSHPPQQAQITTGTVVANGLTFHYLAAGDVADTSLPLALLLHGFPDTPYTWEVLLPQLARAGYRAVAPFMRGYAPTTTASTYQVGALVQDANALHDALGGRFGAGITHDVIIGHDWGAIAALGSDVSSDFVPGEIGRVRWSKVVSLGAPPASGIFVIAAVQGGNYDQIKMSFYFWFFGHTVNSNPAFAANSLKFIDRIWEDWTAHGFDASSYIARAKQSLQLPPNYTAALDYYRATAWGLSDSRCNLQGNLSEHRSHTDLLRSGRPWHRRSRCADTETAHSLFAWDGGRSFREPRRTAGGASCTIRFSGLPGGIHRWSKPLSTSRAGEPR